MAESKTPKKSATKAVKAPKPRATPRPARAKDPETGRRTALAIAAAGLDKKAQNVEIIDVRGKVDYADFVVVMSGRSDRQVNAICRGVEEELKKQGVRCFGVEGLPQAHWALMDFGDVVVHVFDEDTRGYYDLEALWIDATRLPVPADGPPAKTE
ncbi:MAG: ribosome silencing factor [Polyangiales bacterium]